MTAYTVAVREPGKIQPWAFIGSDGQVYDTALHSKPLSLDEARLNRQRIIAAVSVSLTLLAI